MTHDERQSKLEAALIAQNSGNLEEAARLANEVLSSTDPAKSDEREHNARAAFRLGFIELLRSNFPHAMERFTSVLALSESAADNVGMARALGGIGSVHLNLSDYAQALEYYGKALTLEEKSGNKAGVADNLGNIGLVHTNLADYPKALEYYGKALALEEELENKRGVALNLGNIGIVHSDLADYPTALEYYSKALTIDEELVNKSGAARHLCNIGIVHLHLADNAKALEYFLKALTLEEQLENKVGVANNLGNIGIVNWNLADYSTALEYFSNALVMDEELGNKSGVARHLGNIGGVHESLGDYAKAQEYLLKALHLSEEIGAAWPRLHWLQALGTLYSEHKQLSHEPMEAERYLKLAIDDSTAQGVKYITRDSSKACYLLFKEQKRWQEALEMKELHDSVRDEINVEEARKQESIREQQKEIELTRARTAAELKATTGLLHRVLPESIATRIIAGEEEIADYFPTVSILFADIAGFTPISADMPAIVVVRFLNFVFAQFDSIMKRHGCEKIKTIGDGYMAIAGAPNVCDDHAERLSLAALEMQQPILLPDDIREHMPTGTKLGVRIGLHTGSVVAGVIGEERFVYDIYSDAVNIAARMESHGEENKIHVSNDFYRHLQNRFAMTKNRDGKDGKSSVYTFEKRGEMEIKGKGMMRTYFLEQK